MRVRLPPSAHIVTENLVFINVFGAFFHFISQITFQFFVKGITQINLLIKVRHYPDRGAMSGNLLIKVLHLYKSKLVNDSGDYPDFAG